MLTDNLRILITDEEIKLKRLKTIETTGHCTVKNRNRDNKILERQKYFATGKLVYVKFFNTIFYRYSLSQFLKCETT